MSKETFEDWYKKADEQEELTLHTNKYSVGRMVWNHQQEKIDKLVEVARFYKENLANGKVRDFYYGSPSAKRAEAILKELNYD